MRWWPPSPLQSQKCKICCLVSADVPVWPVLSELFLTVRWVFSILLSHPTLPEDFWYWGLEGGRRGWTGGDADGLRGGGMIKGEMAGSGGCTDRKQRLFLSSYHDWVQPQGPDQRRAPCFHLLQWEFCLHQLFFSFPFSDLLLFLRRVEGEISWWNSCSTFLSMFIAPQWHSPLSYSESLAWI